MRIYLRQVIRFGVVGLVSNALLYLLYVFLTKLGVGPKLAVSMLYVLGFSWAFAFNKGWSFSYVGAWGLASMRFVLLYFGLYAANIMAHFFFADNMELPHDLVQAAVVVFFIPIMFLLQKYWVFRKPTMNQFGR